jgi:hypothetical protein
VKILIILVISGISAYYLFKLGLYIYRPFLLSKLFRNINSEYCNLLVNLDRDINSAVASLEEYKSSYKSPNSDRLAELQENIDRAKAFKVHEQTANEKLIRLRERYIDNPKRLSESIVVYSKYLSTKIRQRHESNVFTQALITNAMSIEEFNNSAKETVIILEECERKLDIFLEN